MGNTIQSNSLVIHKKMLEELIQIKSELKNMNKNLVMVNNELMRLGTKVVHL